MTYTFKLSRRLAAMRFGAVLLPVLAACAGGDPTGISPSTPTDNPEATTAAPSTDMASIPFTSVTAVRKTGTSATLSWQVNLAGVTKFEVQKAVKATTPVWGTYNYPAGSITSEAVALAQVTASYCFRIRASQPTASSWSESVCVGAAAGSSATASSMVSISMTPDTVSLNSGATQQFSAAGNMSDGTTTAVIPTYGAAGGTISATGLYTAGSTAGSYSVIATVDGKADTSVVTIAGSATLGSVVMTPASVSLNAGATQEFSVSGKMSDGSTVSVSPTYSATGGTISATGVYTAGTTAGGFRVIATAQGKADTSAITISSSSSSSSLWWSADFESGAFPKGTSIIQCVPGRVNVYDNGRKPAGAPTARGGSHFVGLTVLDTDVEPCTPTPNPRANARKDNIFRPGTEIWEAYSIYIPNGFPSIPWFFMVQEDYGAPYNSTPPNAMWLQNWDGSGNRWYLGGDYDPATKSIKHVWDGPKVTTGIWHDFMVHKRFATDKSGWVELWFDGQQVRFNNGQTRLTNQQTMLTGATAAGFQLMHYRHANMFPVSKYPNGLTIYFDEARVGTSRSDVELSSSLLAALP